MSLECGHCGNKVHDLDCPNNNAVASDTRRMKRVQFPEDTWILLQDFKDYCQYLRTVYPHWVKGWAEADFIKNAASYQFPCMVQWWSDDRGAANVFFSLEDAKHLLGAEHSNLTENPKPLP